MYKDITKKADRLSKRVRVSDNKKALIVLIILLAMVALMFAGKADMYALSNNLIH